MDKKTLSERDICTKFITPALEATLCAQPRDRLATTAQTQSRLAESLIKKAVA